MVDESAPLRVLIIGINFDPESAGISPYTSGMAEGLGARGHRVRVITGYPHYPQWRVHDGYRGLTSREEIRGALVTRVRHYVPSSPSMPKRLLMEVSFGLRILVSRWSRPDVVVLVSPALVSSAMSLARARVAGLPVVTWVQDIYTLGVQQTGDAGGAGGAVRAVESWLLEGSTRVVAIHDRFRSYLQSVLDIGVPIDVVRNWSHVEPPVVTDRTGVRAAHGWADDEIVVLHAGNMGAKQGLENVVAAARLASQRGSRIRFVLLGDGLRRRDLEQLDPHPRLQFMDPLGTGQFEQTLAAADVLLVNELPGLTEMSVPSKLTTYWATGVPVVAAVDESSTTADEILTSQAGVLVQPAKPDQLVDVIEELVADPLRCQDLAAAGRSFREERLSMSAGIGNFETTLRAAASATSRPRRSRTLRIRASDRVGRRRAS